MGSADSHKVAQRYSRGLHPTLEQILNVLLLRQSGSPALLVQQALLPQRYLDQVVILTCKDG